MKSLEIFGKNYSGYWDKTRIGCRGIVVQDGKLLLSYETKTDQWMIPGGGLDEYESDEECCKREIAEETGVLVEVDDYVLEICEYYEDVKYIERYFICSPVGKTEPHLTQREKEVGMEPRWLPLEEIRKIFSHHADYAATDEMRRGMYLREYTALREIFGEYNKRTRCL